MATSAIENVIPTTGAFQDQSAVWIKFPNGVAMVWGSLTVAANTYAISKAMGGVFTVIHTILATPVSNPDATVSAQKSSAYPTDSITIGRRPITNADDIAFLVIGRWK